MPLGIITGPSATDHRSREWPPDTRLAAPPVARIAIPRAVDLAMLSEGALLAFEATVERLRAVGAVTEEVDLTPFLECARLLYDGSLVAERYEAFGEFLEAHPESADPNVLSIVRRAKTVTGAGVIADQNRVLHYRLVARTELAGFDALLLPTTTDHPTIADIAADPLGVNARLGTFSNFVNLLDMCAVSVPSGEADGGPFGVTVVAPAFHDQVALDVAALIVGSIERNGAYPTVGLPLAVFGAHMSGLALNHQLVSLGARFVDEMVTAPRYRMFALDGPIDRPGLVDAGTLAAEGSAFRGELWLLAPAALGAFLAGVTPPLMLGPVELSDGSLVTGFGCALPSGRDISEHTGWRDFLAAPHDVALDADMH
jgi:allophanate hydrolase